MPCFHHWGLVSWTAIICTWNIQPFLMDKGVTSSLRLGRQYRAIRMKSVVERDIGRWFLEFKKFNASKRGWENSSRIRRARKKWGQRTNSFFFVFTTLSAEGWKGFRAFRRAKNENTSRYRERGSQRVDEETWRRCSFERRWRWGVENGGSRNASKTTWTG